MDPLQSLNQKLNQAGPPAGLPISDLPTPALPKAAAPQPMVKSIAKPSAIPSAVVPIQAGQSSKDESDGMVYKTMPRGYMAPTFRSIPNATAPADQPQPIVTGGEPKKSFFGGTNKNLIIGGIVALVLIIGGIGGYLIFSKKTPSSVNTNTPPAGGTNNNGGTAVTPPVSNIDVSWIQDNFGLTAACSADNQSICGDSADPDKDGLTNLQEFTLLTDPNSVDTDKDGISDGDEVNVFSTDPNSAHTAGIAKFTDAGDLKYKYNSKLKANFTDADLVQIAANIKKSGLHQPTITTLGQVMVDFYTNYQSVNAGNGQTGSALDRDAQRLDTIKQIGYALLKYQQTSGKYPDTASYDDMISQIKALLNGRAINTSDPTNVAPYLYSYASINGGADFSLGYYSETQKIVVTYNATQITDFQNKELSAQRDIVRKTDLEEIKQALDLYSGDNANPTDPSAKVYPSVSAFKSALVPKYLNSVPTDPKSSGDYTYTVNTDNTDFALQVQLENNYNGKNKYLCNSDGCGYY